jgi:RecA/RadA recombinase
MTTRKKKAQQKAATKKELQKAMKDNPLLAIDKVIEAAGANLKLTPTNLERGRLVKDAVSTGSLALNVILGGGLVPGFRTNAFGKEQGGKSTLLYNVAKSCAIDNGIHCIFYDWEGATDADRVERMGLRVNWLAEMERKAPVLFRYYNKMRDGEQMFHHARQIMEALDDREDGPVQVAFFVDSLPTVLPRQQADDPETNANAMRARLYSNELPLVKQIVSAKRCLWLDTNIIKTNPRQQFGNPEYEMCGEAVRHLSDTRIKAIKTIAPHDRDHNRGIPENKKYIEEEICWDGVGIDRYNYSRYYVQKHKGFSPFREAYVRMWVEQRGEPGCGIDPVYDVFEYLRLTGQIKYNRKQLSILLPGAWNKEREVVNEVTNEKTGEVTEKVTKKTSWYWYEFKDLILNPVNRKNKTWDITRACWAQFKTGEVWELYFNNIVNQTTRSLAPVGAEEAEAEE